MRQSPDNADVHHDILVDAKTGRYRHGSFWSWARSRSGLAGDAVIKARADVNHDVAVIHGQIGFIGAVHPQHAEELPSDAG
jgi:hypothetical protein